jgi:hypothetical protein
MGLWDVTIDNENEEVALDGKPVTVVTGNYAQKSAHELPNHAV